VGHFAYFLYVSVSGIWVLGNLEEILVLNLSNLQVIAIKVKDNATLQGKITPFIVMIE
jgi:hypothetical protein